MTKRKPLYPPAHFDHAWVIPPSFFDDMDMDPQVRFLWGHLHLPIDVYVN